MKLQLWLTETERDTLDIALRFFIEGTVNVEMETFSHPMRRQCAQKCTELSRRRMKELQARIAPPPSKPTLAVAEAKEAA